VLRRFWLVPLIVGGALGVAAFDEQSGFRAWLRLTDDLDSARARMTVLRREIRHAEVEAQALESDPFAIERAIREDLSLARPGETVLRLPDERGGSGPSSRIP
jgi:cell division protein FtsB